MPDVPADGTIAGDVPPNKLNGKWNTVYFFLALCLLIALPISVEQKSLGSIIHLLQYESDDIWSSSTTINVSSIGTIFGKRNNSSDDQQTRVGRETTFEESFNDPFTGRIDQYFDHLTCNASDVHWIRKYFHWHHEMRTKFPDETILTDPDAPNIAILYQDPYQKGGLTDRVKGIGHAIQLAHGQHRVIFFKWYTDTLPLESFLAPHLLNFTLPFYPTTETARKLKETYTEGRKGNEKVMLWLFKWNFGNYLEPFGDIWSAVFRPSAPVQAAIEEAKMKLDLVPGQYDAVHCRVGHPAFQNKRKYKNEKDRERDFDSAFKFQGMNRVAAMSAAIQGIRCAAWAASSQTNASELNTTQKIFFYADSTDLVKAVVSPETVNARGEEQVSLVEELKILGATKKIAGRQNAPVTHLMNRNNSTSPDAFVSTFVDLYLASQARCISMGVGRFAYLAAKIGGTKCWTRHQIPAGSVRLQWGMKLMSDEVPPCPVATMGR